MSSPFSLWRCSVAFALFAIASGARHGQKVKTMQGVVLHDHSLSSEVTRRNRTQWGRSLDFPEKTLAQLEKEFELKEFVGGLSLGDFIKILAVRQSDMREVILQCLTAKKVLIAEVTSRFMWKSMEADIDKQRDSCEFAQYIRSSLKGLPGANRFSQCYGGWYPGWNNKALVVACSSWSFISVPSQNLEEFYTEHAQLDETALMVFKQLLEALAAIASLDPPAIHRLITPRSMTVADKEHGYALSVDTWPMAIRATYEDLCHEYPHDAYERPNREYGPPEDFAKNEKVCPSVPYEMRFSPSCGDFFHSTNEKICGSKYDIYSAGVIFMEIIYNVKKGLRTTEEGYKTWRQLVEQYSRWDGIADKLNHDQLEEFASKSSEAKELAGDLGLDLKEDNPFAKVFKEMVKTLHKNPRKRPSAEKLLKLDVFKNIKTPELR